MTRLFLAVWPPADVVDQIAALPRPDEPGVRWTRRDQWHITLRFLGNAEADDVITAVAPRTGVDPVEVALGPAVSRLGRSVICLPAAGLDALAAGLTEQTAEVGEPPDPRPFSGHLTLARLRHRGVCGLAGERFSVDFVADEVTLVSSTTRSEGPEYEILHRWPV